MNELELERLLRGLADLIAKTGVSVEKDLAHIHLTCGGSIPWEKVAKLKETYPAAFDKIWHRIVDEMHSKRAD